MTNIIFYDGSVEKLVREFIQIDIEQIKRLNLTDAIRHYVSNQAQITYAQCVPIRVRLLPYRFGVGNYRAYAALVKLSLYPVLWRLTATKFLPNEYGYALHSRCRQSFLERVGYCLISP